jgi:hypothetical protein
MTGRHKGNPPIGDLEAGDKFRRSLLKKADDNITGAPLWHGWAIMDAFLAGIEYARANPVSAAPPTPPSKPRR